MSENKVDIGVLEEISSRLLHPKFFPSKVGGKPAWLDLQNLLTPEEMVCKICEEPLIFVCQVYAPYEESDDSFHRTIYLFVCRNGLCCRTNSTENFAVFRSQLPRSNDFYSYEPCDETDTKEFPMGKWPKLCIVCGAKGPSHCSKCKKAFYCSRKHQILDWQRGHKQICPELMDVTTFAGNDFTVTESGRCLLFKEWELVVDEEDEEEATKVDEKKEMDRLQKMMREKKAGTLCNISEDELQQYAQPVPEDKVFNKFSKRVSRHPDQVLRYDRGGNPLWITENIVVDVPNCQYCHGERQFEFQIMPQLLNFIDVGIDLNSIDWGVLAVFTCKKSCNGGPSYKKEHLIKQDLSQ